MIDKITFKFNHAKGKIEDKDKKVIASKEFENDTEEEKEVTFEYDEKVEDEYEFFCNGVVRIVEGTKFETGVPMYKDGKVSDELTEKMEFEYGDDTDIKRHIKGEATVKIPPN